jgi:hypothetical protein
VVRAQEVLRAQGELRAQEVLPQAVLPQAVLPQMAREY